MPASIPRISSVDAERL
jgi:hypothetical protein